jgi:hypothetical protein
MAVSGKTQANISIKLDQYPVQHRGMVGREDGPMGIVVLVAGSALGPDP